MVLAGTLVAQHIAFGVIAAVIVIGALLVVTTNNVVRAALYLVAVLAGVGASFLLLGAEFVGITQILVYIGAIVVLFLFGIMLTRAPIGPESQLTGRNWPVGIGVGVALAGVLGYALVDAFGSEKLPEDSRQLTAQVSDSIFSTYLVPFEVVSVLLLAALVGAIVLARKE
jgi:NADH-quinone oxidoreductase subunit J